MNTVLTVLLNLFFTNGVLVHTLFDKQELNLFSPLNSQFAAKRVLIKHTLSLEL